MPDFSLRRRHCWRIDVVPCDPDAFCCRPENMDLVKLEVLVGNSCAGSIKRVTVNGNVTVDTSFTTNKVDSQTATTWRLLQLGWTPDQVAAQGFSLCITLADPCASLRDFCMGGFCRHAFLSSGDRCCPTGDSPFIAP
ncbi:hypothetical protein HYH03_018905 [Edaphochlamys debaryana]|uniref:Pherophorin domain-containing protein n=1 Tax=Edaphochlamys debaryana TaxID=47281 RepID=A0A835XED1_9CHLO|nr:hypothetical protein HYH03_018905 [Edaphochlamys debaryana]|eukprot:KAG2482146.1 hypothetical protein HYH03_018905 [Edaphochlamys debaryana]